MNIAALSVDNPVLYCIHLAAPAWRLQVLPAIYCAARHHGTRFDSRIYFLWHLYIIHTETYHYTKLQETIYRLAGHPIIIFCRFK